MQPTSNRPRFPHRLHCVLRNAVSLGVDDILSWDPPGEKFIIYNQDQFTKKILPTVFKQSKFSSFRRQISAYGFEKISTRRMSTLVYSHKHFKRDDARACDLIKRRGRNQGLSIANKKENTMYTSLLSQVNERSQMTLAAAAGANEDNILPYQLNSRNVIEINCHAKQCHAKTTPFEVNRHKQRGLQDSCSAKQGQGVDHLESFPEYSLKKAVVPDSGLVRVSSSTSRLNIEPITPFKIQDLGTAAEGSVGGNYWKKNLLTSTSLASASLGCGQIDLLSRNSDIAISKVPLDSDDSFSDAETFDKLVAFCIPGE